VATSLPLRYALAKTTQLMDQPMKLWWECSETQGWHQEVRAEP
jgi:hypothetical protein